MKKGKFLVATSLALVMTFGMNMASFAEELETAAEENISEDAVTLEKTGVSEFVDAKGILTDGSIEDISRYAIGESSDTEVAIADQGRILAQSKGDAIITVK